MADADFKVIAEQRVLHEDTPEETALLYDLADGKGNLIAVGMTEDAAREALAARASFGHSVFIPTGAFGRTGDETVAAAPEFIPEPPPEEPEPEATVEESEPSGG
jgi:hypothetical protein